VFVVQWAGEGALGPRLAQHLKLRDCQPGAPFSLCVGDLKTGGKGALGENRGGQKGEEAAALHGMSFRVMRQPIAPTAIAEQWLRPVTRLRSPVIGA
jgi:hypothetical protein